MTQLPLASASAPRDVAGAPVEVVPIAVAFARVARGRVPRDFAASRSHDGTRP
jgi:hypothetical protein